MNEQEYAFLTVDEVLELHSLQLANYGGLPGIRDRGLIESAVMMSQASFGGFFVHANTYEMAAAYAFHIAENQPFIDGNKRTGLAAALVFLDWHQIEINDPNEDLYKAMIDLSSKNLDKPGLAVLFQRLSVESAT